MKLPLIPQDKANHLLYGFVIYCLSNLFLSNWYSVLIVFVIALSKEISDEYKYKGFDWFDLLTTMGIPILLAIK